MSCVKRLRGQRQLGGAQDPRNSRQWINLDPVYLGYTTGKVMKAQKDRQEYIDDFYAAHPDAPRPLSRYNSHGTVYTASSPLGHQQHMG